MQNKKFLKDDEIYLGDIIKKLWKKKILIFSISLFFALIGYFVANKLESEHVKIYKTTIEIRQLPTYLLEKYKPYIAAPPFTKSANISSFDYYYNLNFISDDNLIQFAEQNKDIGEFKTYLKNKNIDLKDFFIRKLENTLKNSIGQAITNYEYSLTFEGPLQGEKFLNNYAIYIKNKTEADFKQYLMKSISNEINILEQNLVIAEKLKMKQPILFNLAEKNSITINEPKETYYKGTIILSQQLIYLKELYNEVKQLKVDYDPILLKASSAYLVSPSSKNKNSLTVIFGVLGLFCSFIVIFIKSHLR